MLTADQTKAQGGTTLNWSAPPADEDEAPAQKISAAWGQKGPTGSFTVEVKIGDYGAYGTLTAQLVYGGQNRGEAVSIPLPRDDNGNKIADGWEANYKKYTKVTSDAATWAESDLETGPDYTDSKGKVHKNGHPGDGFSVFEEYRGFKLNTGYKRFSPLQKEVLISVIGSSITSHGIGYASYLKDDTGNKIVAYRVSTYSGSPNYWANYKGTDVPGHQNQRVVRVLENAFDSPNRLGWTEPIGNPSVYYPNVVDYIYIYTTEEIDVTYPNHPNQVRRSVIGHEIGHAINLDHCDGVHSSCIMRIDAPPTTRGDRYDSDHAVNLNGYKIRK